MAYLDLYLASFRKGDCIEWSGFTQNAEQTQICLTEGARELFTYISPARVAAPQAITHGRDTYNGDAPLLLRVRINKKNYLYQSVSEKPIIINLPQSTISYNMGHVYNIFVDSGNGRTCRDLYLNICGSR